jgi:hypothetical protein
MLEVDVKPDVPEAVSAALRATLGRGGVILDERPGGYSSPWRRAAAREAVENEPRARGNWIGKPNESYTLSPRSTRGATRA